ncbi:hypothetical protein JD546_03740 [Aeromonas caviae]|jgi:hypothetical protein|uniref:hypothetical protein n=1 Tax=Aeromonas caviae TaxID=648 RepID=UPI00191E1EA1|nr:hypothetical protein [Aeromonas caviae]MBL0500196.1 hypothetical protein [Aeromonas caviae]MBL0578535.1 hypothetical protein [Aeromonas caviae]
MEDNNPMSFSNSDIEKIRDELNQLSPTLKKRALEKFGLAALGSIPWIGGFISAAANIKTEENTLKTDALQTRWLEEHENKIDKLYSALLEVSQRFEQLNDAIDDRIQDESYLDLVRKSFRAWDTADTDEKRMYICNLITNAAGTRICSDDVVRLFIDWLNLYHEAHFAVIKQIYSLPGISRYEVWSNLYGETPREDSAEADLYKLLIRDLSTGGVIRQARDTNEDGQFLKTRRSAPRANSSTKTLETAFEQTKPYVLTELGKQFVHYTMNNVVTRLSGE